MTYVGAGANDGNASGIAVYSTQDADSEGEEGKFFVWTPDEIREILGDDVASAFIADYSVTPGGNFEGKNILEFVGDHRPAETSCLHQ